MMRLGPATIDQITVQAGTIMDGRWLRAVVEFRTLYQEKPHGACQLHPDEARELAGRLLASADSADRMLERADEDDMETQPRQ